MGLPRLFTYCELFWLINAIRLVAHGRLFGVKCNRTMTELKSSNEYIDILLIYLGGGGWCYGGYFYIHIVCVCVFVSLVGNFLFIYLYNTVNVCACVIVEYITIRWCRLVFRFRWGRGGGRGGCFYIKCKTDQCWLFYKCFALS